jgi:hypothetical protein
MKVSEMRVMKKFQQRFQMMSISKLADDHPQTAHLRRVCILPRFRHRHPMGDDSATRRRA